MMWPWRFALKQCVLNILGIVVCRRVVIRSLQIQGVPISLNMRTKRFAIFFAGVLVARLALGKMWDITFRSIRRHAMTTASTDDVLLVSSLLIRPVRSLHHWLLLTGIFWCSSHPELAPAFYQSKLMLLRSLRSNETPWLVRGRLALFFFVGGLLASQLVVTLTPVPARTPVGIVLSLIKMPFGIAFAAVECFMIDEPFAFSIDGDSSVSATIDSEPNKLLPGFDVIDAITRMAGRLAPVSESAVSDGEPPSPGLAFLVVLKALIIAAWQPMFVHAIASYALY